MKQRLGGMSPTSGYHVRVKLLASQVGGKVPTTHGYPPLKMFDITFGSSENNYLLGLISLNNETGSEDSFFSSFMVKKK
jgi:hypothetical protein